MNLAEYDAALEELDNLTVIMWDVAQAFDDLVAAIEAYEDEHYPIGEPTWWGRIWFRFEQQVLARFWRD